MKILFYSVAYVFSMVFIMPCSYAIATIPAIEEAPNELNKLGESNRLISLNETIEMTKAVSLQMPAFDALDIKCFASDTNHGFIQAIMQLETSNPSQEINVNKHAYKHSVKTRENICPQFLLANYSYTSQWGDEIGQFAGMQQLLNMKYLGYKNPSDNITREISFNNDEDNHTVIPRSASLCIVAFIGLVAVARRKNQSE